MGENRVANTEVGEKMMVCGRASMMNIGDKSTADS